MTNEMFEALNDVAESSWHSMVHGIAHGIGPGEESLTDTNLIRLAGLPSTRVKKFTRAVEATNGADWEWWIGSSEEELWLKLRVQAKRSSHDGVRYEQLAHHSKNQALPQYETLIVQSIEDGALPLHAFYNGWPTDRFLFQTNHHDVVALADRVSRADYHPSGAFWSDLSWGCTLLPTQVVKRIFEDPASSAFPLGSPHDNSRTLDKLYVPRYLTHSTPWAYLFRSDTPGALPTFEEVLRNLYRIQGDSGRPPDDEFERFTYRHPSPEAEQAVYGPGKMHFEKSAAVLEERERRAATNKDLAHAYLLNVAPPADFDALLDEESDQPSEPTNIVLTELSPEANFFMN